MNTTLLYTIGLGIGLALIGAFVAIRNKVNVPILSFLRNQWPLLLITVAFYALTLNDTLFAKIGAIMYIPVVVGLAGLCTQFGIHIFFRESLEDDIDKGEWLANWDKFKDSPYYIPTTLAVFVGIFHGICIIAASLAK